MDDSILSPYSDAVLIEYSDGSKSLERVVESYNTSGNEPIHTLFDGETLQSIAFANYGDSGLWYKIADANNIINPFEELIPGMQLIIPTL